MEQTTLKVAGLYSFPNRLSSVPEGALLKARNIVINRDNVAESRRGFDLYGNEMPASADTLLNYKGRILRHVNNALEVDIDGAGNFQPFNLTLIGNTTLSNATVSGITTTSQLEVGMFVFGTGILPNTTITSIVDNETLILSRVATSTGSTTLSFNWNLASTVAGLRLKGIEQNSNFYFTTSNGIKKISASTSDDLPTAVVTNAGGVQALDLQASLLPKLGLFNQESTLAYRLVWGIKDVNNNLILGAPSGRTVISNPLLPLLTSDFNNLLTKLDTLNLVTGINGQNYLSSLKVPANSDASILRTNLVALTDMLDNELPQFGSTQGYFEITGASTTLNSTSLDAGGATTSNVINWQAVGAGIPSGTVVTSVSGTIYTLSQPCTATATNIKVDFYPIYSLGTYEAYINVNDYTSGGTTYKINQYISINDFIEITGVVNSPTSPNLYNSPTNPVSYYQATSVQDNLIQFSPTDDPGTYSSHAVATVPQIRRRRYSGITQPTNFTGIPSTDQLLSMQAYYDAIVDALKTEKAIIIADPTIFYSSNSTQSSSISVTFSIPPTITTAHFYQLYRTVQTTASSGTALSNDGSGNPYDPGDEQMLAYESNPTLDDLNKGSITYNDITPDSFLGAYLYTNPNSGQGIAQSNNAPPIAKDITNFRDYTFYANTKSVQTLQLSMLSVLNLVSGVSKLTITDGVKNNVYTFVQALAQKQTITTVGDVSGSLNNTYFTLNSGTTYNQYYVWFTNGTGVDPSLVDKVGVPVSITNGDSASTIAQKVQVALHSLSDFTVTVSSNTLTIYNNIAGICDVSTNGTASPGFTFATVILGQGEDAANKKVVFTPSMSGTVGAISVATNATINSVSHGLVSGQVVQIANSNSTPNIDGTYQITVIDADNFTIPTPVTTVGTYAIWQTNPTLTPSQQISETSQSLIRVINKDTLAFITAQYLSSSTDIPGKMVFQAKNIAQAQFYALGDVLNTGKEFEPQLPTSGNKVASTNDVCPNRVYYSKYQQPDAVPLLNYIDVGPKDKAIVRVLALRDNLFIMKEEGIYRLSGYSDPFTVYPFDFSTHIKAPDSAVVLNNLIYCMTNQGVATVSDTGVSIISRPIEDEIINLTNYPNFKTATFGVSYESDRAYYLFTISTSADLYSTQCFRFNTFTNTWTLLDLAKRSGIVNDADDRLYLSATDVHYIEQERKSFDRTDYADRTISLVLGAGGVNQLKIAVPTVKNIKVGDVLLQTQNLTINQLNQLLQKLDSDTGFVADNFITTLQALPGVELSGQLDATITKIANDTGRLSIVGATPASTYLALLPTGLSFLNQQDNFNALVNVLNNDIALQHHNYIPSVGTIPFEFSVTAVDTVNNTIAGNFVYPLIQGNITLFNHINTDLQFVPQALQDVSIVKQVSEGTFIFEDTSFSSAVVSYSSDVSANFESISIAGNGNGIFGRSRFGSNIYGGNSGASPFRTFIPKEKQRCRYINVRFQHGVAREIFSFYGVSLTYNPISQRGWR